MAPGKPHVAISVTIALLIVITSFVPYVSVGSSRAQSDDAPLVSDYSFRLQQTSDPSSCITEVDQAISAASVLSSSEAAAMQEAALSSIPYQEFNADSGPASPLSATPKQGYTV